MDLDFVDLKWKYNNIIIYKEYKWDLFLLGFTNNNNINNTNNTNNKVCY